MKSLKIREVKYNSEITEQVNVRVWIQIQFGINSETEHVTTLHLLPWASAYGFQSSIKHFPSNLLLSSLTYWFYDFYQFQCLPYLSTHWFSNNSIQLKSRLNAAQEFTSLERPLSHCRSFYGFFKERHVTIKLHTDILLSATEKRKHWHQTVWPKFAQLKLRIMMSTSLGCCET